MGSRGDVLWEVEVFISGGSLDIWGCEGVAENRLLGLQASGRVESMGGEELLPYPWVPPEGRDAYGLGDQDKVPMRSGQGIAGPWRDTNWPCFLS